MADGPTGEDVLADVVRTVSAAFGDRLTAVYAMGSLAHGGFSPLVSDVDVAVILASPGRDDDAEKIAEVGETVRDMGSPLHSRVSIFWGTPDFLRDGAGAGRFPPLDRLCLFQHGRLLTGTDTRNQLQPPTREELTVAGARFAADTLSEAVVSYAADPASLLANGVRATTKAVLFPVRFLYTADTGLEGTNDAAVEHYAAQHRGPAADLVAAAFRWRSTEPDKTAAAELLNHGFTALYTGFLDDHIDRLQKMGETELADRFVQWRARL